MAGACVPSAPSKASSKSQFSSSSASRRITEARAAHAQKRGGDARKLSIDARTLEGLQSLELVDHETPEQAFERHFARAVVCQVLDRMAEEARGRDKAAQFAALRCYLEAEGGPAYADKAAVLGMGEGAVRVAVHRLRERFRELLLVEVRHTLADPDEAIDEIDQLLSALAGPEKPGAGA